MIEGIPKYWENPFLFLPYRSNPAGLDIIDDGLAVTVERFDMNPELQAEKFKVPTLQNVELRFSETTSAAAKSMRILLPHQVLGASRRAAERDLGSTSTSPG